MIELELVDKIWSDSNINPRFLKELKMMCAPVGKSTPPGVHTLSALATCFCTLFEGNTQALTPIVSAWNVLRLTARLLDDLEDGTPHLDNNLPLNINLSTGLFFTAVAILDKLEAYAVETTTAATIRLKFHEAGLKTCSGQHIDLLPIDLSLDECWEMVEAKSGAALALICWAGARLGTRDEAHLNLAYQFGLQLGILDQIADDLRDLWPSSRAQTDIKQAYPGTLPIVYTRSVLPPDQADLFAQNLALAKTDPTYEAIVRQTVIESGAALYLAVQSTLAYNRALALIEQLNAVGSSANMSILTALLNQIHFVRAT